MDFTRAAVEKMKLLCPFSGHRKALEKQVCNLTLHRVTRNVQPTALGWAVTDKATTTVSKERISELAFQTNGVLNHDLAGLVSTDSPRESSMFAVQSSGLDACTKCLRQPYEVRHKPWRSK